MLRENSTCIQKKKSSELVLYVGGRINKGGGGPLEINPQKPWQKRGF